MYTQEHRSVHPAAPRMCTQHHSACAQYPATLPEPALGSTQRCRARTAPSTRSTPSTPSTPSTRSPARSPLVPARGCSPGCPPRPAAALRRARPCRRGWSRPGSRRPARPGRAAAAAAEPWAGAEGPGPGPEPPLLAQVRSGAGGPARAAPLLLLPSLPLLLPSLPVVPPSSAPPSAAPPVLSPPEPRVLPTCPGGTGAPGCSPKGEPEHPRCWVPGSWGGPLGLSGSFSSSRNSLLSILEVTGRGPDGSTALSPLWGHAEVFQDRLPAMTAELCVLTEIRPRPSGSGCALAVLHPCAPPAKRKCSGHAVPRESTASAAAEVSALP